MTAKYMLTESLDSGEIKAELNCENMELNLTFADQGEGVKETLVIKESEKLFKMLRMLFDPPERPIGPGEVRIVKRS